MSKDSKELRKRRNKARRDALKAKKNQAYRRKNQIAPDEEEVRIAPLWRRVIQFCIDQFLLGVFVFFSYAIFMLVFDLQTLPPLLAVAPQIIMGAFYFIPIVARNGQTLGMKKMKIVVLNAKGTSYISTLSSTIRWFVLYAIPNSYFLVQTGESLQDQVTVWMLSFTTTMLVVAPIIVTSNRRGFHDIFANSMMVELPESE